MYDFLDFHLWKMSIYLETLCWKEVLQKCNSQSGQEGWVGLRMYWLEKKFEKLISGGVTPIRHQKVIVMG